VKSLMMDVSADPDLELGEVEQPELQGKKRSRHRKFEPVFRLEPGTIEVESDNYPGLGTVWAQVKEKNETKNYNFERFETLQLLNLTLLQYELRKLADEIYTAIGDTDVCPADRMGDKAERLRAKLKEYSK
jgi:hypothetical protein